MRFQPLRESYFHWKSFSFEWLLIEEVEESSNGLFVVPGANYVFVFVFVDKVDPFDWVYLFNDVIFHSVCGDFISKAERSFEGA